MTLQGLAQQHPGLFDEMAPSPRGSSFSFEPVQLAQTDRIGDGGRIYVSLDPVEMFASRFLLG
jgi:hypothetical protein